MNRDTYININAVFPQYLHFQYQFMYIVLSWIVIRIVIINHPYALV